jgi:hypothetical protein
VLCELNNCWRPGLPKHIRRRRAHKSVGFDTTPFIGGSGELESDGASTSGRVSADDPFGLRAKNVRSGKTGAHNEVEIENEENDRLLCEVQITHMRTYVYCRRNLATWSHTG